MLRSDAITQFLQKNGKPFVKDLYYPGMEVLCLGDHKYRMPAKRNQDPCEDNDYTNKNTTFMAIGLSGWDYRKKRSVYVGFDFDSIVQHKAGISPEQLQRIRTSTEDIEWTTIIKSTSGTGLHIYVFLEEVEARTGKEHKHIAKVVLAELAKLVGIDLEDQVDHVGDILWIWKSTQDEEEGFKVIKQGSKLKLPDDWKERQPYTKTAPTQLPPEREEEFQALIETIRPTRDEEHMKLIRWLSSNNYPCIWEPLQGFLTTHTFALKKAHEALKLKGIFNTLAEGSELPMDQNCFMYPMYGGAWRVVRYTEGVKEAETWFTSENGWTTTYFNKDLAFEEACKLSPGVPTDDGGFAYTKVDELNSVLESLGSGPIEKLKLTGQRYVKLKKISKDKAILEVERNNNDPPALDGWFRKGRKFMRTIPLKECEPVIETESYDDKLRFLITENPPAELNWVIRTDLGWTDVSALNMSSVLNHIAVTKTDAARIRGEAILHPWILDTRPFQSEYPGKRRWNRRGARLRYTPAETVTRHPQWDDVLTHLGTNLTPYLLEDSWAKKWGIETGRHYLKLWLACLFRMPADPLPYLFFFGPNNCGKSTLHEALNAIIQPGVVKANKALNPKDTFNGELAKAVVAVIDDPEWRATKEMQNVIKDLVTGQTVVINEKFVPRMELPNYTHWIHCDNYLQNCPVFDDRTRATLIEVPPLPQTEISKFNLIPMLEKQAPSFLRELMDMEIPEPETRLRIPVIDTPAKQELIQMHLSGLQLFLRSKVYPIPGQAVGLATLMTSLNNFLSSRQERIQQDENEVIEELKRISSSVVVGDLNGHRTVGNVSMFKAAASDPYVEKEGALVHGRTVPPK